MTDGTDPLQNAIVQVTDGITPATATTDVDGHASFSLNAATYTVAITKAGFSFTPTSRTVTGNQSGTLINDLVMTQVIIPPSPPVDPVKGVAWGSVVTTDDSSNVGIVVQARIVGVDGPCKAGSILIPKQVSTVTDADGVFELELYGNDSIVPAGTSWLLTIQGANFDKKIKVLSGGVTDCDALI